MGMAGQRHASAALPPGRGPDTHYTGCWVGPRAGLDGCGKSHPPTGIRTPACPGANTANFHFSYLLSPQCFKPTREGFTDEFL